MLIYQDSKLTLTQMCAMWVALWTSVMSWHSRGCSSEPRAAQLSSPRSHCRSVQTTCCAMMTSTSDSLATPSCSTTAVVCAKPSCASARALPLEMQSSKLSKFLLKLFHKIWKLQERTNISCTKSLKYRDSLFSTTSRTTDGTTILAMFLSIKCWSTKRRLS